MALEWEHLWALALLPVGVAAVLWIDRRYALARRSRYRTVTMVCRCLVVVALVLAIAAPSLWLKSDSAQRWVLIDASYSARDTLDTTQMQLAQALRQLPDDQQLGVIAFGKETMIEMPITQKPSFSGLHAQVKGESSDLDAALRFAAAMFPSGGAGGLTLLTDGKVSVSDKTTALLSARGIKTDVFVSPTAGGADAQLTELTVPSELYEGQRVPLRVTVDATEDMQATLVLSQNGISTAKREVTLHKGENRFAFSDTAQQTGVVTWQANVIAVGDTQAKNNMYAAYTHVLGAPIVLVVSKSQGVDRLLSATGMRVETIRPEQLPKVADGYLPYDAVVLNNIDHDAATPSQWQALDTAVRSLGRGLTVLGGDSSYALGGYRGTELEALLPVTIDVKHKQRMPALSLILVIDKSGSMTAGQFGSTRIEVAKEAAMSAVEVLTERDNIGVIGFDDAAKWVVPFQMANDAAAIQQQIGTMRASGGTAYYTALSEALRVLLAADTPQKHVIFLSDGEPGDSGFEELALAMHSSGITLTTVAVGEGADQQRMKLLATLGGGRHYAVGEFDNVPKIFTKETMLVGGNYVQNRVFTPVVTEKGSLTAFEGFPELNGYLTTAEKPTATVALMSDMQEPLLAWWRAGAGTVVAWTSDAEGGWTQPFISWEEMPNFFSGMVAKTLRNDVNDGELETRINGDMLHICYTSEADKPLHTTATVLLPDGTERVLPMTQTAPNQYETSMVAPSEGAYVLRVSQKNGETEEHSMTGGAVRGYSDEYDLRAAPDGSLDRLCAATGGRMLTDEGGWWDTDIPSTSARKNLRDALCVLAACLLVLDIALRKLPWCEWLDKAGRKPQTKECSFKPQKPHSVAREQKPTVQNTTDALLSAKRARKQL